MTPLHELVGQPWLITEEMLASMIEAARRGVSIEQWKGAPEPIEPDARLGMSFDRDEYCELDVREGVAVIPVRGYLTAQSYWWGDRASYEWIAARVEDAIADGAVRAIVLNVDSAGGQVAGCDVLARRIVEARDAKPVTAIVGGQATSAAYWLASAASRILVTRTTLVGSIGVLFRHLDTKEFDEREGFRRIEIVSSQSPDKALDPATKHGRERVQAMVDQLAGVFVADVAQNRGVSEAHVIERFGRGWVVVGQEAIDAQAADGFGSLEEVIESAGGMPARAGRSTMETVRVSEITADWLTTHAPTIAAAIREAGAGAARQELQAQQEAAVSTARTEATAAATTAERERMLGILREAQGMRGQANLVLELLADPAANAGTAAQRFLAVMRGQGQQYLNDRRQEEAALGDLGAAPPAAGEEGDKGARLLAMAERLGHAKTDGEKK